MNRRIIAHGLVWALWTISAVAETVASDILAAVHLGDVATVRRMLADDATKAMGTTHKGGVTPLHYAVSLDRLEIVRILLKSGMPVDLRTDNKTTPLHWAADKGALDCLRLLLGHGAAVDACAANGWTPLHFAAKQGGLRAARYLFAAGALPDVVDNEGDTPLHVAAAVDQLPMVMLLLENGASATLANAAKSQAIDMAKSDAVRRALAAAGSVPSQLPSTAADPATPTTSNAVAMAAVTPPKPMQRISGPLPREASVIRSAAAGTAPPMPPRTTIEGGPNVPVPAQDLPPMPPAAPLPTEPVEPQENTATQTVELSDGSVYRGEIRRDKFHGYGTLELENGQKYAGAWYRGRKEGIGTFSYPNGDSYSGEWRGDMPHGKGVYQYGNGGRVEGVWRNGMLRSGEGVYVATDGSRHRGVWRDNELVETERLAEQAPN